MKTVSLSGSSRESVGKKDAKKLRGEGQVPCVLYGGEEQLHFQCKDIDLQKIIFSPDVYQIELDVNGTKKNSIIREVQTHPVTGRLVHIDFLELIDGKPVAIELPIRLSGNAAGVRAGGRLNISYRKVAVRGNHVDFPEAIEVDISPLEIGQGIRIRDIEIPGLTILAPESAQVVSVKRSRVSIVTDEDDEEGEGGDEAAAEGAAEAPKAEEGGE